jgi:DMSO/TMAO reductase YedYZ molybdopterin-dependent catalytic subunit
MSSSFWHGHRRTFLRDMGCLTLALSGARLLGDEPMRGGLIVRQDKPENLEFPFDKLDGFRTAVERFYVRNHFGPPPGLDARTWQLEVTGAVTTSLKFTLAQFAALPSVTRSLTVECAGNDRAFLVPQAKGVPWTSGAISTADWTGPTLASLLKLAGVKPGAVEVVLEGADKGEVSNEPKPPGAIHFARSLPLAKAKKPEVVLAHRMNGAPLPPNHGFPVRAVVGGWYGMASVKWLTRIVVVEHPFRGYWQTTDYTIWERRDGIPVLTPITEMQVKASISRPQSGTVLPPNSNEVITGAAWAGEADVTSVEVSTDGGKTWQAATLMGDPEPFCWRMWEFRWKTPAGGKVTLLARATDSKNRVQPLTRDPDRRNYLISHCRPLEVAIRAN